MNKHVTLKKKVFCVILAFAVLLSSMSQGFSAFAEEASTAPITPSTPDICVRVDADNDSATADKELTLTFNVALNTATIQDAAVSIALTSEEAAMLAANFDEAGMNESTITLTQNGEINTLSFMATGASFQQTLKLKVPKDAMPEGDAVVTFEIAKDDIQVTNYTLVSTEPTPAPASSPENEPSTWTPTIEKQGVTVTFTAPADTGEEDVPGNDNEEGKPPDGNEEENNENEPPTNETGEGIYQLNISTSPDMLVVNQNNTLNDTLTITTIASLVEGADVTGISSISFDLNLTLPSGITLPSGAYAYVDDSITAAGEEIGQFTAGTATVGVISYAENTLTIPITQPLSQIETETPTARTDGLQSWTTTLTLQGSAFTVDANAYQSGSISVSVVPEDADLVSSITTEGTIKIDNSINAIVELPDNVTVKEKADQSQTIIWQDNNNADGLRPATSDESFQNLLYFKRADGEWQKLTTDNLADAGLTSWPIPSINETSVGGYTITYTDLPTKLEITADDGLVVEEPIIEWCLSAAQPKDEDTVTPPSVEGYEVSMKDENQWVYVRLTDFIFSVDLRMGTFDEGANQAEVLADVEDKLCNAFTLYKDGETYADSLARLDESQIEIIPNDDDPTKFTVTVKGLPKYDAETSALIDYQLKPVSTGEDNMKLKLDESLMGEGDENDFLAASFNNSSVPNHHAATTELYSGGTLVLTLTGDTDFKANKEWLDWASWNDNKGKNRPETTYYLWRYPENATFEQASQVSDDAGTISITLTKEQVEKIEPQDAIVLTDEQRMAALDKYNADGYRYIYFLKEVINYADGDDRYDQVFGKVERQTGEGDVKTTDTLPEQALYNGEDSRVANDTGLYNGGTLSNRLAGNEEATVQKEWNAAAFQGHMDGVEVEFTLYVQYLESEEDEGLWYPAEPEVKVSQDMITEENMGFWQHTENVPAYGPLGRDVEYRWVETAVIQDGQRTPLVNEDDSTLTEDTINKDKSFTLIQNERNVKYTSESETNDGVTTITNSIADTIDYDVTKLWLQETQPKEVTFVLYQLTSGSELTTDSKPYLTFILNDNKATITDNNSNGQFQGIIGMDEEKEGSVNRVTFGENDTQKRQESWQTIIHSLPQYDDEGREYEYLLLEKIGSNNDIVPNYETTRNDEGNYTTIVTNGPGTGVRILVRKEWSDDSDSAHRGAVTIRVYKYDEATDTSERVSEEITLEQGVWMQEVGLPNVTKEDLNSGKIFIIETQVGSTLVPIRPYEFDDPQNPTPVTIDTPGAEVKKPETDDVYQYETEHHRYEATYSKVTLQDTGQTVYTVNNRRLGNIDLTVTKEWQDGDGQLREKLAAANAKLDESKKVTTYLELTFGEGFDSSVDEKIEDGENGHGYVTLGSQDTFILDADGTTNVSYRQQLESVTATQEGTYALSEEVHFFNLPKYDPNGSVATYDVKEIWVVGDIADATEDEILTTGQLKGYLEGELREKYDDWEELSALLDEFSTSVTQTGYEVNDHDNDGTEAETDTGIAHDTQSIKVTNKLSNTKDVQWYKIWNDEYTYGQHQRPDLYLDVYRVGHERDDNGQIVEKTELVKEDYLWQPNKVKDPDAPEGEDDDEPVATEIDPYNWTVTMFDVAKYDSLGYEIDYFAVERTPVNFTDYDYTYGEYRYDVYGDDTLVSLGDRNNVDKTYGQYVITKDDMKTVHAPAADEAYPNYALIEEGTFVNSLKNDVIFQGQKIWAGVPEGYANINLPPATFNLYRVLEGEDTAATEENLVATKTVSTWGNVDGDGSYENGTYVFTFTEDNEGNELARYNEKGQRYVYFMQEAFVGTSEDDKLPGGVFEVQNPSIDEMSNTFVATNTYKGVPEGEIYVRKHLKLPNGMTEADEFPSIQFKLTRSYMGKVDGQEQEQLIQDTSFNETIYWESADVVKAYSQQSQEPGWDGYVTSDDNDLVFDELELYAPNGSEFVYTVTEVVDDFLYGYETFAGSGDLTANETTEEMTEDGITGLKPERAASDADDGSGDTPSTQVDNDSWATFKNNFEQAEITFKGTKVWDDFGDAFHVRPTEAQFKDMIKVTRSAATQPGMDNAISEEPVKVDIEFENSNADKWIFTITGENDASLDVYAPNGMPWTYKLTENLSGDLAKIYTVKPSSSVSVNVETDTDKTDDAVLSFQALTNSMKASVPYAKIWIDQTNQPITDDFVGGDLTVSFKAQVREKDGGTWTDAEEYFKKVMGNDYVKIFPSQDDTSYFERILTGAVNNTVLWKSGTFDNLPSVIKKNEENSFTYLEYRVVETSVQLEGKEAQKITIGTNDAYTIDPEQGIVTGATLDEKTSTTTNKLKVGRLSITKKWEDDNNAFGTRPPYEGNYTWKANFIVEKQTNHDSWETLKNADGKIAVFTLYGTNAAEDSEKTLTLTGLPQGTYRVVELQPDYEIVNNSIDATYRVDEQYYNNTYSTEYDKSNAGGVDMAFTITNTLNHSDTDIVVKKIWQPDNKAPQGASIVAVLQYSNDDGKTWDNVNQVTLDESNGWQYTWDNLPAHYPAADTSGAETKYRVVEDKDSAQHVGYIQSGEVEETTEGNTTTFIITNVATTSLTVNKEWHGVDENIAPPIDVQIFSKLGDGDAEPEGNPVKLNAKNGWTYTFSNLPACDKDGTVYTYFAREVNAGDTYFVSNSDTMNKNGFTTTITNIAKTSITGTKTWNDNGNLDARPEPDDFKLILSQRVKGQDDDAWKEVDEATLTWTNTNTSTWTYTYNDLPKTDENGNIFEYKVEEVVPKGYKQTSNDGKDFTNTITGITSVSGTKTWYDNNGYGRPENLTLTLERSTDGTAWTKVNAQPEWSKNGNIWTYNYNNLAKYDDDGVPYQYRVTENAVDGYAPSTVTEDGQTNFINAQPGDLVVEKEVTGNRGDQNKVFNFTVTLEGTSLTGIAATSVNGQKGEMTFTSGVATFQLKHGEKMTATGIPAGLTYTVTETEANQDSYSTTSSGDTGTIPAGAEAQVLFTNHKQNGTIPATTSVTVEKEWKLDDGGERADAITVELLQNGKVYDEVTLSDKNDWRHTWRGLALGSTWTVHEKDVPEGFVTSVDKNGNTFTITNDDVTVQPDSVRVDKAWITDDGGTAAESITVQLFCDGKAYGDPVTLSATNDWSHVWNDLPAGHEWNVEEENVPDGFTSSVSQNGNHFIITNDDVDIEPTSVQVNKVWITDDGGTAAESVTVQLYCDGKPYGDPVILSAANNWSYVWDKLDSDHEWLVVETDVPDGFTASVSQKGNIFTITNNDTWEETTSYEVKKNWLLNDGGTAAKSVAVQLLCDGAAYGDAVTLSDANDWHHLWENLPVGHTWSVREVDVPAGFTASVNQEKGVFTIINDDKPKNPPDTPVPPGNPGTPSTPGKPGSPNTPQTGDPTNNRALLAVCGVALAAMLALGVGRKAKKRQSRDDK